MSTVSIAYGTLRERLVRLQVQGGGFRVNDANFPASYQALSEAAEILDVSPVPKLYLHHGTGHIASYATR